MQMQHFHEFAPGDKIISMVPYKDMIVVATDRSIYVIKDGKICLMEFEVQEIARK